MTRIKCVRCGRISHNYHEINLHDIDCAPCCEDCLPAVETETMQQHSMWPSDWHGGWSWYGDEGWMYYPPKGILKSREN